MDAFQTSKFSLFLDKWFNGWALTRGLSGSLFFPGSLGTK